MKKISESMSMKIFAGRIRQNVDLVCVNTAPNIGNMYRNILNSRPKSYLQGCMEAQRDCLPGRVKMYQLNR